MKRKFFYDTEFMEEPGFLELISIGIVDEEGNSLYLCNREADMSRANAWVRGNVIPLLPSPDDPSWMTKEDMRKVILDFMRPSGDDPVELWGYYADYDHVNLCWIFGRMVDLPKGMPMFTMDLKQRAGNLCLPPNISDEIHNALVDARWTKSAYDYLVQREASGPFWCHGEDVHVVDDVDYLLSIGVDKKLAMRLAGSRARVVQSRDDGLTLIHYQGFGLHLHEAMLTGR